MAKNQPPKWDLRDFYKNTNDSQIQKDQKLIKKLASDFIKKYKGKINSPKLTPDLLLSSLKDIERLDETLYILQNYAYYLHAQDSKDSKIGQFYQQIEEFGNKSTSELLWFLLEWQKLDNKHAQKLLKGPLLSTYKHFLSHARAFTPFRVSEAEEIILTKKSMAGSQAFIRLYDETSSQERFALGKQRLTMSQLSPILKSHPSRSTRKQASEVLTQVLKKHSHFYTFTLNNLLLDKKINDEIRGYDYPQQATFLSYEMEPKVVETMTKVIEQRYDISERFYKTKAKLLKQKLFEWDRYSVLYPNDKIEYSWEEAKEMILKSFKQFSPVFYETALKFFDNGWIDALITPNKRGGGFCSYSVPAKHPMILVNFAGTHDDVSTLAHELGHGIHAYLSRGNTLNNYYPSTATAEIASIFCENILFDQVYSQITDKKVKLNMLANKIQGGLATIFRQNAFYLFENDIHNHRRQKGELATSDINNYWQHRLQPMFGKSLTLTQNHEYWWMYVLHFYHYNFYVFTYAFGEALTNSLYEMYRENPKTFVPKYLDALTKGGSQNPKEILSSFDVDLNSSDFWNKSLNLLEEYVEDFEKLV
ncbi:MAG: PepF/M3 family oligoendopeptidase [Candidatus Woesebacteria bacterium GW2011_GWB1_38_5b]|uniref:PepF/M3 family oligoendopeptidase n=1 Tax=Candidatus Woesebacteria bacterium GW2011_GWB1_38_5b TaxID=1618569 RepID=A0A0G0KKA9_9BACT|nr:MAG: PepF/M3 family oligoendopeptidase [Candidatus Woesebacteria bacterium GW2011_GWB1_38_5b]